MRALWIEDHQLIGDALEQLLHVKMPEISLDKARDLPTALTLVRTFRYELVLLDWWLDPHDGETTMPALAKAGCTTPVIVVSNDDREPVKRRAIELGAVGYVAKSADPQTLIEVIRNALRGVPSPAAPPTPKVQATLPALKVEQVFPELTPRQAEVYRALIRGWADKQIARELGISETTVKTHVRAILQAVGVNRRGEAAHEARIRGAGGL